MTSVRAVWGSSEWCIYRTCLQLIFQHSFVQGAKTGCWKHKPPDTTGNSSVTGKSHSFGWPLAPVSLETRVNAHLGPSISYKNNSSKLIGCRQKSCHSSHCQSFQSYSEPHTRRQRSKSVRYREILFQELLRRTVLFIGCWLVSPRSIHHKGKFKVVRRK